MKKINIKTLFTGSIFVILSLATNAFNYITNIIIGYNYSLSDFGKISLIFSIIFLISIPTLIILTFVSNNSGNNDEKLLIFTKFIKKAIFWGFILTFINYLFFFVYKSLFKFDIIIFSLLSLQAFIAYPLFTVRGYLQGKKAFLKLGINIFIEVFIKVILVSLSIFLGIKNISLLLTIICFCSLISLFNGIYYVYFTDISLKDSKLKKIETKKIDFVNTFIGIAGIYILLNIDMILVGYFIPNESGIYAIFTKLGQMIFMLGNIFIGMSLPYFVINYFSGKNTRNIFIVFYLIISLIGIFLCILFYFFHEIIIKLMFHKEIIEGYLLFYYSLSLLLITLSAYIINYFISIKKYLINIVLIFTILFYLILIFTSKKHITSFVFSYFYSSIFLFTILSIYLIWFKYNKIFYKS